MIKALVPHFIKDYENTGEPAVRERYGVLSSVLGIGCNLLLFCIKFALGTFSGSIAVTADAFNNLSDLGSSVVTMLSFKLAARPPDKGHPYGHGRIEYLSGLLIAALILLVGAEFVKNSVAKILSPSPVLFSTVALAGLGLSVLVKLWMCSYNRYLGKQIDSSTLEATAADSLSDAMATGVTMISIVVARFTDFPVDGIIGLVVALLILKAGYGVAKNTISPLLGQAPDPAFVQEIRRRLLSREGIVGIHDLLVHDYGPGRVFISVHAEVPSNVDMMVSHDVIDNAERELQKALGVHLVIHMDPVQIDCEETNHMRQVVGDLVAGIDPAFHIHDFRMVKGITHSNLIFDLEVPIDCATPDPKLAQLVEQKVLGLEGNYYAVVTVDRVMFS